MGTDIHLVMEWLDGKEWRPFNADPDPDGSLDSWGKYTPFPTPMEQLATELGLDRGQEEVYFWNFGRDYESFGQLVGVRSTEEPLWECGGYPQHCSEKVWRLFHHLVDSEINWDDNTVNEEWVERMSPRASVVERFGKRWVRNFDYHSPGCIRLTEMEHTYGMSDDLDALIRHCKKLAQTRNIPFDKIRMTFAFDS